MNHPHCLYLALILGLPLTVSAQDSTPEEVLIIGVRDNRTSTGATGLNLEIQETPQSISVVDRDLMDAFGTSDINDALELATGVRVERWETNRTNYGSRGFEIKNTQIDGVGLPNNWGLVRGAMDSFGYEKLEIIRGANGLLTGVGNASGTINYVRKRPSNHREGSISLTAGSWSRRRLEADYTTPLTDNGNWAGRVVMAVEAADSHLRGLENDRAFVYGVVDGQLTPNSTLAAGYSYQDADSSGNMWGGLVFANSDGTQAEWDVSASTTQDWTYWDIATQTAFLEYTYLLPNDWELQLAYNYRAFDDESQLFFAYTVEGLDPETGEGLIGWPGKWPTEDEAHLLDAKLSGSYDLFGSTHELIAGINRSEGERIQYTNPVASSDPAFGFLPAFPYEGDVIPEPVWGDKVLDSRSKSILDRYYGATRLVFGNFSTILGFNAVKFEQDNPDLGNNINESEVSPYIGLSYGITDNLTAYASYSDIYQPQDYYDINRDYLDPSQGVNYEAGAKLSWIDGRLLTTFAVFKAEQKGLGTFAGLNPETGQYYYVGEDVDSNGYEIEFSGTINDYVRVLLGYTSLALEDQHGDDIYNWVPRDTVNFAINATLPGWQNLSLGLAGNWQSDIHTVDGYTGLNIEQSSYLLLDTFLRWQIDNRSSLQLNVNNLSDEKFITSLYEIGYYGPPRNASVSYQLAF